MSSQRDVFEDNTAGNDQQGKGSPATTYEPGEKPFKDKGRKQGTGYTSVPGAGENPSKSDD